MFKTYSLDPSETPSKSIYNDGTCSTCSTYHGGNNDTSSVYKNWIGTSRETGIEVYLIVFNTEAFNFKCYPVSTQFKKCVSHVWKKYMASFNEC